MRYFILFSFLIFSLTGCGGGSGGGDSASTTPPVIIPPVITNPLNGIYTFANGVQVDANPDTEFPLLQKCQRLDKSIWNFPTTNYTLTNTVNSSQTTRFTFGSGWHDNFEIKCTLLTIIYPVSSYGTEADIWGNADHYWLVTALDGGIYMMKCQTGTGRNGFNLFSIADSPKIFLPATLSMNTVWVGGMISSSTMITESPYTTSPGLTSGCYKFRQTFTDPITMDSTAINWWYLPGSGFVDRYNLNTRYLYSRTPFANG